MAAIAKPLGNFSEGNFSVSLSVSPSVSPSVFRAEPQQEFLVKALPIVSLLSRWWV
jgi:hypothetical protein